MFLIRILTPKKSWFKPKNIIVVLLLAAAISGSYFLGFTRKVEIKQEEQQNQNKYTAFLMEIYGKIQENYWEKVDDEKLIDLYLRASEKLSGQFLPEKPKNKEELAKMYNDLFPKIQNEEDKKKFTASVADAVLTNLQPFGRSHLYSKKDEKQLANLVLNKNPDVDQYQVLGVEKNATEQQIDTTYQEKKTELEQDQTPEGKQKLAQLDKAYQTLSDEKSRQNYDQAGIEPTIDYRLINPKVFYMHLTRFSPTTLDDIKRVTEKVDQGDQLDSLIFDLRDNIGGTIDGLPYFLGPFIGNNRYAYQFFHQGEYEDFKTKIGFLPSLLRYKKVVILINENSQSTSEVMASVLKKYNVGVLMGKKSKGWGTIEKVYALDNQIAEDETYSMFLVNSVTLREDDQPIEGRGVEPAINIDDPDWEKELYSYYSSQELIDAVKEVL